MWWIWILFVVVLAVACYHVYVSAEHHELHKIRATFEKVELNILNNLEHERNIASKDGVTFGELPKEAVQGAAQVAPCFTEQIIRRFYHAYSRN